MNLQEAANCSGRLWAGIRFVFSGELVGTILLIFFFCRFGCLLRLLLTAAVSLSLALSHTFGDKLDRYPPDWIKAFVLSPFRWNVVGLQGSLMSYFTEPIYFSSIILGSLYHADHLSRAMYQRITEIEDLPQSFSLNRPLLSGEKQTALLQMITWQIGHFQVYQGICTLCSLLMGVIEYQGSLRVWFQADNIV